MKPTPAERDNLVNELVSARTRAKVSEERLAKRAGFKHKSSIQHIESKRNMPTPEALRAYASLCGLDAEILLLDWGYVDETWIQKLRSNPQLRQMLKAA